MYLLLKTTSETVKSWFDTDRSVHSADFLFAVLRSPFLWTLVLSKHSIDEQQIENRHCDRAVRVKPTLHVSDVVFNKRYMSE